MRSRDKVFNVAAKDKGQILYMYLVNWAVSQHESTIRPGLDA
jgi:hypothetical protein